MAINLELALYEADKITRSFEKCARVRPDGLYEAYPDPYSDLGKALQRVGLWNRYINGQIEIPSNMSHLSGAPWTIGWGQTGKDVFKGVVWTKQQCDERHRQEILMVCNAILKHLLKREPTAYQLAALISFAYNVGLDIDTDTKAEGLGDSSLLAAFNRGEIMVAANKFMGWVYAGGVKSQGLINRRTAERALFLRTG